MQLVVELLIVLVLALAASTLAGALTTGGGSALMLGVFAALGILVGYLLARPFLVWHSAASAPSTRLLFPAMTAVLNVASAFFGLGPVFASAFSASLVPAHAGMTGSFVGIAASAVVVTLGSRLVAGLLSGAPWFGRSALEGNGERIDRALAWGLGALVLLLLMIGHGVAGPIILRHYGPDASYQSAISSLGRGIVLATLGTVVGAFLEGLSRGHPNRRRVFVLLWALAAIAAVGDVWLRFAEAGSSDAAQWWLRHRASRP